MINALGGSKKDNVVKEVRKEEIGKGWKRRKEIGEIYPENRPKYVSARLFNQVFLSSRIKPNPNSNRSITMSTTGEGERVKTIQSFPTMYYPAAINNVSRKTVFTPPFYTCSMFSLMNMLHV